MLSRLLVLFSLVISASADGYSCAGNTLINPPEDLTYIYPAGWTEGQEPAKYAGNQMCNWQINVPQGYYAKVIFYKNTDMESGITCVYPNGLEEYIEDKEHNPYIFTSPQFQVNLRVSDKQGEFSFKVVWVKYPAACSMKVELDDKKPMASVPNDCVTTYTAPHKVVLVGYTLADDLDVLLRQSAIYEGDSVNGEYLGNLYYARYRQVVSKSNKLTIYTFGLDKQFNYTLYMGMDSWALGDVESLTGMNCPSQPNKQCYLYLNSEVNVSAVATISMNIPDFLQTLPIFPGGSTLKVYEGQIADANLLTTIDSTNYMNQLPLEVKNSLKIYQLNSGRLQIPMTQHADKANYKTVFDGRVVNIHSFDYRMPSYRQDTLETFSTGNNEQLYFKFNVKNFDINGNTTLDVQILRQKKIVYSETFSSSNQPSKVTIKVLGDEMSVNYRTYGSYTSGFEVDLVTTKNDISPVSSSTSPTISTSSSMSTSSTSIHTTSSSSDSPIPTGSTMSTRGSTPRYETSTKSGNGIFSFLSVVIIGCTLIFS